MNNVLENNNSFKVEEGTGAYVNYQKYGIEWYQNFVWKWKDSPHFLSALKEAQEHTHRRQHMYLDAMISSPFFLEKYFWKQNIPYIQDQIDAYTSPLQNFSKPEYIAALDNAYKDILHNEHNQKLIEEYIKNQVITTIKNSSRFALQHKKQEKDIADINKLSWKNWLVRVRKETTETQNFYQDIFKQKVQDFYDKKEKEISARKKEYCKEYFLKAAEKKVWESMYSPVEMNELENIKKWLESTIIDIKIEDRTDEITDTKLQYNGESAVSAMNSTKSLLKNKDILRDHLFNLLVEIVEVQYYQALLKQSPETKNLVVKKPPLVDDIQSGADFVVIDPDNTTDPYTSYDLKTTMLKRTVANETTANKYDKWIVKHVLQNADLLQELKDTDPEHDLLNDEIKIRKKRPLWWMFAATWQKWPIEKFVVKKDVLWFPSNLAYTLLSRVMAKVATWQDIKDTWILDLINEHNEDFQKLTTYMQSDIAEWNRLVHINQSCSNLAKNALFDVLTMRRTW